MLPWCCAGGVVWGAGGWPGGSSLPAVCDDPGAWPGHPAQDWQQVRENKTSDVTAGLHLSISYSRRWLIRRTLEDFQSLDRQLHTCVYDRRYSQLPVIHQLENIANNDKVSYSRPHRTMAKLIVFTKLLKNSFVILRERER